MADLILIPASIKTLEGLIGFVDSYPPRTLFECRGRVISLVALHPAFFSGKSLRVEDRGLYHRINSPLACQQAKTIEEAAGHLVDQGLVKSRGEADYDSLKRRLARNYRRDRKIPPRE